MAFRVCGVAFACSQWLFCDVQCMSVAAAAHGPHAADPEDVNVSGRVTSRCGRV